MDPDEALLAGAAAFSSVAPASQLWRRLDWLDRLDRRRACTTAPAAAVAGRLETARLRIEASNEVLFARLRASLRQGRGTAELAALLASRPGAQCPPAEAEGFDVLDELFAGLFAASVADPPQVALAPGMVGYQPTPARHVLDLLARTGLQAGDVLVDIGAGLGQVALLAGLCSPARALGIEIEPTLVRAAREAAATTGLADRVRFRCADACATDLSSGTVFYLYTPLRGALLADLLARLRAEAARRPLRVCGFGPCVETLAAQAWLCPQGEVRMHRVTVFGAG